MSLNSQPVGLNEVDTSKGYSGVFVQSVVESRKGENLVMTIILEQNVDEENIRTRKLQMLAGASQLATCMGRDRVIKQIRQWIETTEGDGALTVPPD